LRSKRAITSPVRARSKASGLTRIRVRLTAGAPFVFFGGRGLFWGAAGGSLFAGARRFRFAFAFPGGGRFAAAFDRRLGAGLFQLAVAFALPLPLRAAAGGAGGAGGA